MCVCGEVEHSFSSEFSGWEERRYFLLKSLLKQTACPTAAIYFLEKQQLVFAVRVCRLCENVGQRSERNESPARDSHGQSAFFGVVFCFSFQGDAARMSLFDAHVFANAQKRHLIYTTPLFCWCHF